MIQILLLAFFVFSLASAAEVTLDQLKWQPNLITKESILADYKNITPDEPPLFTDIPQLVFVSDFAPRGFYRAEKNAKRLNYVSPVWFAVVPIFDVYGQLLNVASQGRPINHTFLQEMRNLNPDIKIVPKFHFTKFVPEVLTIFVQSATLVQKSAQTIVNFCHTHGFDGAVIAWPNPLSKGILLEEHFVGKKVSAVDLYRDVFETLEQVGNVIRKNRLIAILSMEPPVTPSNLESEAQISSLPPQFNHQMMNAYDFLHIFTDPEPVQPINHQYFHDRFLEKIMEYYDYSPKLLIGINFYGQQFPLDEYRKGGSGKKWKTIDYTTYLKVLRKDDAVLTFNEVNKEHELTSESANAFIIFPSLTQLEYCLAHVKQHPGVGIAIWEYGQGLDYFTNLV